MAGMMDSITTAQADAEVQAFGRARRALAASGAALTVDALRWLVIRNVPLLFVHVPSSCAVLACGCCAIKGRSQLLMIAYMLCNAVEACANFAIYVIAYVELIAEPVPKEFCAKPLHSDDMWRWASSTEEACPSRVEAAAGLALSVCICCLEVVGFFAGTQLFDDMRSGRAFRSWAGAADSLRELRLGGTSAPFAFEMRSRGRSVLSA
mmetsp:Transcript_10649/g.30397  ORF Transcript_10649/g.30397 Transcript_10649/m.30397 type:complete len:208 (+) Transcript_10649:70-693(+)